MFSEIAEIKSIREQKSKLSEREKELTEPILTDLDMIGTLYRWFQEIISQRRRLGWGMLPKERNSSLSSCFCTLQVLSPAGR